MDYQGDLTDILRATGGAVGQSDVPVSNWEFPFDPSSAMGESRGNLFGDPFCNTRDPLLHELNVASSSSYFSSQNSADHMLSAAASVDRDHTGSFVGANRATTSSSSNILAHHKVFEDLGMHKAATPLPAPCNIFSRIQISPNNQTKLPVSPCNSPVIATGSSPRGFKPSAMVSSDIITVNNSKGCLMENTGQVQISSPRNMGIKRRKSQAKKVVCIPAPAAANSRPGGEVVPSDLWAWRKYGQKPIKGSPYPRSQPLKSTAVSKNSTGSQSQKAGNTKEEQKESSNETLSPTNIAGGRSTVSASVKEEFDDNDKQMEMEDTDFSEGFSHSYKPSMPDQSDQDFFAELGEIDADPLELLFTHEFNGDEQKESKDLDPFSIFDWSGDTFGEAKKGL
ncbi:WRKY TRANSCRIPTION FACTOR 30-RELATED-RELATED [Salix koriyanagi]|uniref:WRKY TRANSCRIPTION FACTOR 30-RELATED-RELATED n=1 Tax=Salix koriyanagi TaxID=2511006 RepID=A0A9Q1AMP5_9ROSI|nr:WRKY TRANSCRIPTION FACTOR 30-RELATED-RELATED [Salix koriyanagi]